MSHFRIRCRNCARELTEVYCVFCEHCKDSLLVTEYFEQKFRDDPGEGIWRFNWLPVHNPCFDQPGTVVYRSKGLADYLGLENLYIAFNGFWPENGALLKTCTFKEFEAAVILQNAIENKMDGLIVASAGNTARAFTHLAAVSGYPVIIVVPNMCLMEMWYLENSLRIPTLAIADGDYADSIDVARRIASVAGFPFEGGVKNIAKRDGLGIVLLETVSKIGRLPDHYFQAVGSGSGAIGVWEMAERFIRDGRYGTNMPVLHLAQNIPFAPMFKAWGKDSRELFPDDLRPELISEITTRVLSTRYPAYTIKGGVYDALMATQGKMYGINNEKVYSSMDIFIKTEGIDIVPASGVAVSALDQAVKSGTVQRSEIILLNITGGGEKRLKKEFAQYEVRPLVISKNITEKEIERLICEVLKRN
ncbi:MAG: cysteate synthase [Nitrospirota bacterium]